MGFRQFVWPNAIEIITVVLLDSFVCVQLLEGVKCLFVMHDIDGFNKGATEYI